MDLEDPARAVMAPATSAVLRVLVQAPDARFSIRQLARVAGVSHNAAQTVVRRLSVHGVVLTTPAGSAVMCTFKTLMVKFRTRRVGCVMPRSER